MTDHAERRAGALALIEALEKEQSYPRSDAYMREKLDTLYPPPEPERVWVQMTTGAEYSISDGELWYRDGGVRSRSAWTVDDIRVLASLVPGLVVKPVQPTAWLATYPSGTVIRYESRRFAMREAKSYGARVTPIVELPEVPRDA